MNGSRCLGGLTNPGTRHHRFPGRRIEGDTAFGALLCCKPRSAPIVVPNSDFRANEMQPRGGPALAFSRRGSVGPIGTEIERLRASEDLNGATAAALREALAESPGFSAEMHDEAGASTM